MRTLTCLLLSLVLLNCTNEKKLENFNFENYLKELISHKQLPGFILQDYKMDSLLVKKDTSHNGQFIKYSLKKENIERYSYAILHKVDSLKLKFITILNHELYKNNDYCGSGYCSNYTVQVFRIDDSGPKDITKFAFERAKDVVDFTDVNKNCQQIIPMVSYDSISLYYKKYFAVFNWDNNSYKLPNENNKYSYFELNHCSNPAMAANLIENKLNNLAQTAFKLSDISIVCYHNGNKIDKIKAVLPNRNIIEYYYQDRSLIPSSQSNLFYCLVSERNSKESYAFDDGKFLYKINRRFDTINALEDRNEEVFKSENLDIYNLSQKSINLFNIKNNQSTYNQIIKILDYVKSIDISQCTSTTKEFAVHDWPISGSLKIYTDSSEVKYIHVSYGEGETSGTNHYIYLRKGKPVYVKVISQDETRGMTEEMLPTFSPYIAFYNEEFYSGEKIIACQGRQCAVGEGFYPEPDERLNLIEKEIDFYNPESQSTFLSFSSWYWFEFSKSNLSLEKFDQKYNKSK